MKKMYGTRLDQAEIDKVKAISRALALTEQDALTYIIRNFTPSPALTKALRSLRASDAALAELRASVAESL